MIKVTNIDYVSKTVGSIEVTYDNVKKIDYTFIDNTFTLNLIQMDETNITQTIQKPIEIIEEDITPEIIEEYNLFKVEEVEPKETEDDQANIKWVIQELKEELKETDESLNEEEPEIKHYNLDEFKVIFHDNVDNKNTAETYFRTIKQIYTHFKADDVYKLFQTKTNDIINHLENEYKNISTLKSKYSSLLKAYQLLNINSDDIKYKVDYYRQKETIKQDKEKQSKKESVEEGNQIITDCETKFKELQDKIKEDTSIITNWHQDAQLYCILYIYLNYGVIRPSELINCKIIDYNDDENNHINVKTKQIIIHKHKNEVSKGTKIIDIDNKLNNILKIGLDKHLTLSQKNELFNGTSSFSKLFNKYTNHNVYDLRKAISSKAIDEGNKEQIERLEYYQGHQLKTILNYYNIYNIKDCLIYDTDDEEDDSHSE